MSPKIWIRDDRSIQPFIYEFTQKISLLSWVMGLIHCRRFIYTASQWLTSIGRLYQMVYETYKKLMIFSCTYAWHFYLLSKNQMQLRFFQFRLFLTLYLPSVYLNCSNRRGQSVEPFCSNDDNIVSGKQLFKFDSLVFKIGLGKTWRKTWLTKQRETASYLAKKRKRSTICSETIKKYFIWCHTSKTAKKCMHG